MLDVHSLLQTACQRTGHPLPDLPPPLLLEFARLAVEQATPPDRLEIRFNPEGWQWEQHRQVFPLQDLSRNDLLQVACECIEVLERVDTLRYGLTALMENWRNGDTHPDTAEGE